MIYNLNDLQKDHSYLLPYSNKLIIYRIFDSQGRSYIGSTYNIINRLFNNKYGHITGDTTKPCARLKEALTTLSLAEFNLEILSEDINDTEELYITKYDSFLSGYNMTPTGLGGHAGHKYVHNGSVCLSVPETEVPEYLDNGWYLGRLTMYGRWHMHNPVTKETKMVADQDHDEYLRKGWQDGFLYNRVFVHKGDIIHNITDAEVDNYLSEGYSLGKGTNFMEGYITITNGIEEKKQHHTEPIPDSWVRGRKTSGKRLLIKGDSRIYVPIESAKEYLDSGYIDPMSSAGTVWICNAEGNTKRIYPSEFKEYQLRGWYQGKYPWVNDGETQFTINYSEIPDYEANPKYSFGKLHYRNHEIQL